MTPPSSRGSIVAAAGSCVCRILAATTSGPVKAGRLMKFRMVVGDREKHEVEVSYLPFLAFLRVKMDGRVIHWSWRLLPGARRRGFEFRTPADELHFLVLEPLHPPSVQRLAREAFRLWMDGQPVATLDGS